jgi:RNA polymerase sigma-70 factor (ECF subfamily)
VVQGQQQRMPVEGDPLGDGIGRVRAVLVLGGVPFPDLDDGVQQVRLRLLEHRSDSARQALRDPLAWAAVVASRVAADWHRNRRRDESLRDRLAARWPAGVAAGRSEEERMLALSVAARLETLPAQLRQVISLRFYADLPVRDIAAALGVPEGTVKSRLHRAVSVLRRGLRESEVT